MKYKGVLLDVGSTLLTANPNVGSIYQGICKHYGIDVDACVLEESFKKSFYNHVLKDTHNWIERADDSSDKQMWRAITWNIYGSVPELKQIDFDKWFETAYYTFGKGSSWKIFDDVIPTLSLLKMYGYKIGVVSNWDSRLRNILKELDLDKYFDSISISAEVLSRKPDSKLFQHALGELNMRPEDVFHVGDLYEEDYKGAINAGISPILIDRYGKCDIQGIKKVSSLNEIAWTSS